MKKLFVLAFAGLANGLFAQPAFNRVAAYTQHPPSGSIDFTGYSLAPATQPGYFLGGNVSGEPDDVASDNTYHYQVAASGISDPSHVYRGTDIVIMKKQASNGAHVLTRDVDIAQLFGLSSYSNETVKGMMIDVTLGRLYIFGYTDAHGFTEGFILCVNTSDLSPVTGFWTHGIQFTWQGSIVMDMEFLASDKYLALIQDSGSIHVMALNSDGTGIGTYELNNPGYSCYGNRLRKCSYNNTYYIAGRATNSSGVSIPMVWNLSCTGTSVMDFEVTILGSTNDSFTAPKVGQGDYVDLGFLSHTKPLPAYIEVIAVGNRDSDLNGLSGTGIYTKYISSATSFTIVPMTDFTNNITVPGVFNNFIFTRCLVRTDGYTVFIGRKLTVSSEDDRSHIGYISNNGTTCQTAYQFHKVHKIRGLNIDISTGDVLVGGCDILFGGWSTVRFASSGGTFNQFVNRTVNQQVTLAESSKQLEEDAPLTVFPNPCTNNLNIQGVEMTNAKIQVLDMKGGIVKEGKAKNEKISIDISDLDNGQYIVKIINGQRTIVRKIVKK